MATIAPFASAQENNGTNPALLTTSATLQYKYTELVSGQHTGLFEFIYVRPFANNSMSWTLTLPFASGPIDKSFDIGDVGVKFLHVPMVNKERAFVYSAELLFDTAARADIGREQSVLKMSGYLVKFRPDGSILAPALVHEIGLGDEAPGRLRVNTTTFDLNYVPKLSDPRFFMTVDPAIVHDWERDATFGSLTVTFGKSVGKMAGGLAQAFVKPQLTVGADRALDWSIQVGFRVLGF